MNIFLTIILGMSSMVLAFAYPFMKRITYWPQLFLGITFNWGIIMAWCSINESINLEVLILYLSAIFWTLGYDTIYGVQDMSDDEIIGLKSTAIKFKENIKLFLTFVYFIVIFLNIYLFKDFLGLNIFSVLFSFFCQILLIDIGDLSRKKTNNCLNLFKFNNYTGMLLFLSIFTKNI